MKTVLLLLLLLLLFANRHVYDRSKDIPEQGVEGPWGFYQVEVPRFLDNRHMKVVRLSALGTGRFYPPPPGNIPGAHLVRS